MKNIFFYPAVVDGHHGMGHVIAYRSMRMAMEKARRYSLGAVAVRNSTHFGIAGYYALMAAAEGMMGKEAHQWLESTGKRLQPY